MSNNECLDSSDSSSNENFQAELLKAMGADQECKTAKAGGCNIFAGSCAAAQVSSGCKTLNATLSDIASATNNLACNINDLTTTNYSSQTNTIKIKLVIDGSVEGGINVDSQQASTLQINQQAVQQASTAQSSEIQKAISNSLDQLTDEKNGFMSDATSTSQINTLKENIINNTKFQTIYNTVTENINKQINNKEIDITVGGNVSGGINFTLKQSSALVATQMVQQVIDSVMSTTEGLTLTNTLTQKLKKSNEGFNLSSMLFASILPMICIFVGLILFLVVGGKGFMKYFPWIAIIGGVIMLIVSIIVKRQWYYYLISSLIVVLGIILVVVSFKTKGGVQMLQTVKSQLK